jgi:hypothetical protein
MDLGIYTTRPHGPNGETSTIYLPWLLITAAFWVAFLNVIGWGVFGLIELGSKVI